MYENTNRLVRHYLPKDIYLNEVTEKQVKFVMNELSNRSKKSQGARAPMSYL